MANAHKKVDKFFLGIVFALLGIGILVFVSASLGVLAKNEAKFYGILWNQLVLGFLGGLISMYVISLIPYKFWRKFALHFFIITLCFMLLIFVPGLGIEHGGAKRWLYLGFASFQPAELLKISFVIYFASWLSWVKSRVTDFKYSVLPLMILLSITAGLLFVQPDTKSFILILVTGGVMLFVSGVQIKHLAVVALGAGILLGIVAATTPYLQARIKTFVNPAHDQSGASYQLKQSLIAIGSGGVFGRGLGQSVQKFNYLPEPQGDSIFSVIGEEFGLVGSLIVLLLYMGFGFRGFRIATRAPDQFSRLLVVGIVILIVFQSLMNIASIVGVFPLTGVPLVFMSQGGTSLLFSLAAVGIILNISRSQKSAI
jgi:cell division protein FtsW